MSRNAKLLRISNRIADEILTATGRRNRKVKCHRAALKAGKYPDHEIDMGGLCRSSLAARIHGVLRRTRLKT